MSPHRIDALPSPLALKWYGITRNGFLPADSPLERLSSEYYWPWECIVHRLPLLLKSHQARRHIDELPVLSTSHLHDEPEWQRAFLVLAALAQAYVWQGDVPSDRLPPAISIPFLSTASHLELQPIASYAALNLWNWKPLASGIDLCQPDNIKSCISFTGTDDESWFFMVSNAMEARAAPLLETMLLAIDAVEHDDADAVISGLKYYGSRLVEIGELLERMDEKCSPQVFYHQIRPWLAGSLNERLPMGVYYDEGDGKGSWRKYRGGSNGQSSLVQFFDAVLGVDHIKTAGFHEEMRAYMPGPHAMFLRDLTAIANIRAYTEANSQNEALLTAYNNAVASLTSFRDKHIRMVTRYVILPSRMALSAQQPISQGVSMEWTRGKSVIKELVGTGGTTLVPFLRESRDETTCAVVTRDSLS